MGRAGNRYVRRFHVYKDGTEEILACENELDDAFQVQKDTPYPTAIIDTARSRRVENDHSQKEEISLSEIYNMFGEKRRKR